MIAGEALHVVMELFPMLTLVVRVGPLIDEEHFEVTQPFNTVVTKMLEPCMG